MFTKTSRQCQRMLWGFFWPGTMCTHTTIPGNIFTPTESGQMSGHFSPNRPPPAAKWSQIGLNLVHNLLNNRRSQATPLHSEATLGPDQGISKVPTMSPTSRTKNCHRKERQGIVVPPWNSKMHFNKLTAIAAAFSVLKYVVLHWWILKHAMKKAAVSRQIQQHLTIRNLLSLNPTNVYDLWIWYKDGFITQDRKRAGKLRPLFQEVTVTSQVELFQKYWF